MNITLGARALSQDGEDLGRIKHLILDADTTQIKAFAVEKGVLFPHDIEVPLHSVAEADAPGEGHRQTVRLAMSAEEAHRLPPFDRSRYTDPPPGAIEERLGLPFGGILWPAVTPSLTVTPGLYPVALPVRPAEGEQEESEADAILRRNERANAVIEKGSDVLSSDGDAVGTVYSLTFDSDTGEPRGLVVTRGAVFAEYRELPASAIASVDDGVVTLNLTRAQVESAVVDAPHPEP